MKAYHILFFLLKAAISIHLLVILFMGKNRQDLGYIINETIFKLSIGLFLGFYFFVHPSGLEIEDQVLISIAGFVILYDINWERIYQELFL
jgi:hypothetical protein